MARIFLRFDKKMRYYFLILCALFFVQCAVQPVEREEGEVVNLNRDAFLQQYNATNPSFTDLQIRGRVTANLSGRQNSATSRIYIQNDERIWVNLSMLGITGARAHITPNKVQAYEVIDRTYIDGDFAFFNEKLKVDFINFERLQQLLLGRMIMLESADAYRLHVERDLNRYVLEYVNQTNRPGSNGQVFAHKYFFDSNFRLQLVEMQDRNSNTSLTANYGNWTETAGGTFPEIVKVVIKGTQTDEITLEYNTFDFSPMDAPFNIPSGYSPREIN